MSRFGKSTGPGHGGGGGYGGKGGGAYGGGGRGSGQDNRPHQGGGGFRQSQGPSGRGQGGGGRAGGKTPYDQNLEKLANEMGRMKIGNKSEWSGSQGQQINLIVNYLQSKYALDAIYEYHVDIYRILPEKAKKTDESSQSSKKKQKTKQFVKSADGSDELPVAGGRRLVENKKACRKYFWDFVNGHQEFFVSRFNCVFDDVHLLWTRVPLKMQKEVDVAELRMEIEEPITEGQNRTITLLLSIKRTHTTHLQACNMKVLNLLLTQTARCTLSQLVQQHKIHCDLDRIFMTPNDLTQLDPVVHLDLDDIFIMLKGLFVTARRGPNNGTALVNYDTAHSAFYKINQANYRLNVSILKFYSLAKSGRFLSETELRQLGDYSLNRNQRREMKSLLTGLKLLAIIGRHNRYSFWDIADQSARTKMIQVADGRVMSIEAYYKEFYNVKLRFPLMPLIQVAPADRQTFLPIEAVVISDQWQRLRRLLPEHLQAMTNAFTTKFPAVRFGEISRMMQRANVSTDEFTNYWDVRIDNRFMEVEGRVIPKPARDVEPMTKQWKAVEPATNVVTSLVIVNGAVRDNITQNFQNLIDECRSRGVQFVQTVPLSREDANFDGRSPELLDQIRKVVNRMQRLFETKKVSLGSPKHMIIFILPNAGPDAVYNGIKSICETEVGVYSQVIKTKNFMDSRSHRNIFLKINTKLGGVVTRIKSNEQIWKKFTNPKNPTLYLGIDVTHPPPGDTDFPSIASVVANTDVSATRYASIIREQPTGMEYIVAMQDMFMACVKNFFTKNGSVPGHIIVFRDGVSESQFQGVMENEYSEMKNACRKISENLKKRFGSDFNYKPNFTLIIVQKRHHTRFWVNSAINKNQAFQDSNNENVPPGTVVDKFITGFLRVQPLIGGKGKDRRYANEEVAYPKEFFLCSHKGLLGTSRPTHYYVIHDEKNMSPDDIQACCYYLCYLFQRAPMPVSIPAPVYYAHLAAYRARKHYMAKRDDDGDVAAKITVRENIAGSMYFQ